MREEEEQEEKSTVKFAGTERIILSELTRSIEALTTAINSLVHQIVLTKKD